MERKLPTIRIGLLVAVVIVFSFSSILVSSKFYTINDEKQDKNTKNEGIIEKDNFNREMDMLRMAYSNTHQGEISKYYNASIQQTYINTSYNTNLDPNDINNNTFSIKTPNSGFNLSSTNITISNIIARNKTLDLELDTSVSTDLTDDYHYALSFEIKRTCILYNFSLYFSEIGGDGGPATIRIFITNATPEGAYIKPTGKNIGIFTYYLTIPDNSPGKWYTFNVNKKLDESMTNNKTFFIYFKQTTTYKDAKAKYFYQVDDPTNPSTNKSLCYRSEDGILWYTFKSVGEPERDITSRVTLSIDQNETPFPSEIDLKINNTNVNNITNGAGYIYFNQIYKNSPSEFKFNISANWYNVSCKIETVYVNFTRIGFNVTVSFNISLQENLVNWTVSLKEPISQFDRNFTNYCINFEVPASWYDFRAYNSTNPSLDISLHDPPINGFRNVTVFGVWNSTNWFEWNLTAHSINLLQSIDPFRADENYRIFNASRYNIIKFNATFKRVITGNDGNINLTIYNNQDLSYRINYTYLTTSFSGGKNITLEGAWDINKNLTIRVVNDLTFHVQVYWNNISDAGFFEIIFTVNFETNSSIAFRAEDLAITGYRGQFFNFTFNYTRDSDNYTILNAQISNTTDLPPGLEITDITLITDTEGNDYYLLKIDTTNLEAQSNPYHVNLSVYNTIGYDSQSIDLILHVLRPKFTVLELTNNLDLFNISNANVNLTIKFKIWDTIKKQYNDTLTSNNITVSMDGVIWNRSDTTFDNGGYFLKIVNTDTHEYSLNISTLGLIFGKKYDLQINITYESLVLDSYQNCSLNVSFYYGHMNTSIEYFDELTITGYRGQLLNFTFNFTRDSDDSFITGATLHLDDAVDGLEFELLEETNQYILSLNTTGMDARTTPYYLNFTVYYDNHQSQFINISLTVLLPLIEVINLEVNLGEFDVINENTNVTLTFKVNDTLNNELITSLSTENITVIEGSNTWGRGDGSFENGGYELYYNDTGQYYILNISTLGLSPGQEYHLIINITYMSVY